MNKVNLSYSNLLSEILLTGAEIDTRNSITKRVRNQSVTFDKTPLVTTRRTAWKNAIREMEWFLSGSSDINDLHASVRKWWLPWANKNGIILNNYSKQFRNFSGTEALTKVITCDQIDYLQNTIKNNPTSRRNVITTWNTAEMLDSKTPITNCHGTIIQAFVDPDNSLHLTMYQRSSDMILGIPHNWIQYWAFLMWLAYRGARTVGSFTWIGGDCHIYKAHEEIAGKIIAEGRQHYDHGFDNIPNLIYTPTGDVFRADDFSLDCGYEPIIKESVEMIV